jgi:OFA family oxalate/formate antiporter-like MFS transporter
VHYGWIVVAAAFTILFLAYGLQYAFGLFFTALTEEFGWTRAGLSGVFSLYAATYALVSLPAGRLTDRWGRGPWSRWEAASWASASPCLAPSGVSGRST